MEKDRVEGRKGKTKRASCFNTNGAGGIQGGDGEGTAKERQDGEGGSKKTRFHPPLPSLPLLLEIYWAGAAIQQKSSYWIKFSKK